MKKNPIKGYFIKHMTDFAFLSGISIAAYGLNMIYKPAAFLFVGFSLIGVSILAARR
ncbi:hypothetical protein [Bacillus sp. FJAT-18017]|uniref:hypothetical protein n=1 Tax=Bacillus sp. FJAT-18017 TaxID=1705566 RepID=UPI000B0678B2|nr:hypothetical protein [Bacillus sp. FJAT-18017]